MRFSPIARKRFALAATILPVSVAPPALAQGSAESLLVYPGRREGLIVPILEQFTAKIDVPALLLIATPAMAPGLILGRDRGEEAG